MFRLYTVFVCNIRQTLSGIMSLICGANASQSERTHLVTQQCLCWSEIYYSPLCSFSMLSHRIKMLDQQKTVIILFLSLSLSFCKAIAFYMLLIMFLITFLCLYFRIELHKAFVVLMSLSDSLFLMNQKSLENSSTN